VQALECAAGEEMEAWSGNSQFAVYPPEGQTFVGDAEGQEFEGK
jgi:hypothetical protein